MKRKLFNLSWRYETALRTHLKQGQPASLKSARELGSQALAAGLQTLDLFKLHEQLPRKNVSSAKSPIGSRAPGMWTTNWT